MSKRQLGWNGQHLGKDPVDLKDTPGLEAAPTELSSSANTRCRSTGDYSMYCMYCTIKCENNTSVGTSKLYSTSLEEQIARHLRRSAM